MSYNKSNVFCFFSKFTQFIQKTELSTLFLFPLVGSWIGEPIKLRDKLKKIIFSKFHFQLNSTSILVKKSLNIECGQERKRTTVDPPPNPR